MRGGALPPPPHAAMMMQQQQQRQRMQVRCGRATVAALTYAACADAAKVASLSALRRVCWRPRRRRQCKGPLFVVEGKPRALHKLHRPSVAPA
jgi:hypothetical protein